MADLLPWKVEPKLTQERLLLLMNVIVRVRRELQPLYTKGDSPWSHGCRAYSWILDGLQELEADLCARGETWLRTQRKNNFFLLWVEGVLVRIYRGDPEKPNERALRIGQQLQARLPGILDEDGEEATADWVWMLSYESTPMPWHAKDLQPGEGLVVAASICQACGTGLDAETRYMWTRPIGIGDTVLTSVTALPTAPFDPGKPKLGSKTDKLLKKKKDDEDGGGDA
jgi:hypothetical protein